MKTRWDMKKLVFVIAALCAAAPASPAFGLQDNLYFIAYGKLFFVDSSRLDVTATGSFLITAPSVARDPDGLYWGRVSDGEIGAFDPRTGRLVKRVALRFSPYETLITPAGKAYVAHNTLTPDGFTISIVDTAKGTLLGTLKGISGLRTDFVQSGSRIFLATFGFAKDDNLYLYEIDTASDRLSEIRRRPKDGSYWRLTPMQKELSIYSLPTSESRRLPQLEVLDLESRKIRAMPLPSSGGVGGRIADRLFVLGNAGYAPWNLPGGEPGLAITDARLSVVTEVVQLPHPIHRIVGFDGNLFVYLFFDRGPEERGLSLCFYDLMGRKEVRRIRILDFLRTEKKN